MIYGVAGQALMPAREKGQNADSTRLMEVAREFESIFLGIILKEARSASRSLSGQKSDLARETYEGMQDDQFARSMAYGKGIGLAEMLYRQLQQDAAAKAPQTPATESVKAPEGEHA